MEKSEQLTVMSFALKLADIGHCAARLPVHKLWVERLEEEVRGLFGGVVCDFMHGNATIAACKHVGGYRLLLFDE